MMALLSSVYLIRKWATEKAKNLPKVTHPENNLGLNLDDLLSEHIFIVFADF